MKIGKIEKQKCGNCPIIDYCGEPYSSLCLCTDSRLEQVEVEEYIQRADKSKLASMKEICEEIVAQMEEESVKPDCFEAEKDVAYPLCLGKGKEECTHCCLWTDWNEAGWKEE